jgi:hypothetical protein
VRAFVVFFLVKVVAVWATDFHDFSDYFSFSYDGGWLFRLTRRGFFHESNKVDYNGDDDECENEYEHEAEKEGKRIDLQHGLCLPIGIRAAFGF